MTKLAAPMPPDAAAPSEPPRDTPSKKRRRTDEIAASNFSSRYTSLSPRMRSNTASELRRPSNSLATPEENRRVSAPSRVESTSPVQANTPKRRRYGDDASTIIFKREEMVCCGSPSQGKLLISLEFLPRLASVCIGDLAV